MRPFEPATLAGRRYTAKALSGVRSAPYLRKWLILGTLIGIVAGLGAVVFYDGLDLATRVLLTDIGGYTPARTAGEGGFRLASGFSRPWAIPLVVAGGALAAGLLVFGLAPEAEGHGTDAAIKAVHTNPKGVRPRVILVKLIASMLTIGSGGSGGREGPTAQISSGFGSILSRTLNLTPADSRICVASGIASGIGAIFRAPFGGALLGVELLYVHDVEIEALIPSAGSSPCSSSSASPAGWLESSTPSASTGSPTASTPGPSPEASSRPSPGSSSAPSASPSPACSAPATARCKPSSTSPTCSACRSGSSSSSPLPNSSPRASASDRAGRVASSGPAWSSGGPPAPSCGGSDTSSAWRHTTRWRS